MEALHRLTFTVMGNEYEAEKGEEERKKNPLNIL